MDAPGGLEVTPIPEQPVDMTAPSPFKIKVRRPAKAALAQPTPLVAEVDIFPTHLQVQLANARRKVALLATEGMKEPESTAGDVSDLEMDNSVLKEDPWSSRKRPAPIVTHIPPPSDPSWIAESRKRIEDHGVPIYTPFTDVSKTVLCSLEDAEKTWGGPKGILAEVTRIAHKAFYRQ